MKTNIISIIAFLLFIPMVSLAQIMPSVPSPTAANLGVYGEIPVSYYTGTPNISIPLYELKGKKINVPISLTYHPAGIRPEIHPGPVGLGWTLQAGGVITRTIIGNGTDESQNSIQNRAVNGYLQYAGSWIADASWKQHISNAVAGNCGTCRNIIWNQAPFSDFEPDEFSFSLPGLSGKFWFDQTGSIKVQCDRPVKVVFNNEFIQPFELNLDYSSYYLEPYFQRSFKAFVIIDEFGTRYSFGGLNAIEFSDPIAYGFDSKGNVIPGKGYLLQANSWFLNKIESADSSDVINFEYERGPFVTQLFKASESSAYTTANANNFTVNNLKLNGTIICPVYLTKISRTNGETLEFKLNKSNELSYSENEYLSIFPSQSTDNYLLLGKTQSIPRLNENYYSDKFDRIQWLKLDTINVKDVYGSLIKAVTFSYNNNSSERLFLESLCLHRIGWLGNLRERILETPMQYHFQYKNKQKLGAYLTCITDHWGFNNGKSYPTNGIITQLRNPDADFMDAGVLSEIRYPTGGYTKLYFEPHDYAKVVDTKDRSVINFQSGTAGGLRVRKIEAMDSIGTEQTREFFYRLSPGQSEVSASTGVLNVSPAYITNISGRDCDNQAFIVSSIKSYPVIPLSQGNDGLYIGYTTVCEQFANGVGGYAKYEYTNHDNGYADVLLANGLWNRDSFPSDPHCSRYFERGRLKNEQIYSSTGYLTYTKQTTWDRYGSQEEDNPRAFHFGGLMLIGGYDYCSSAAYLHYVYKFLPKERTEYRNYVNGQNPVSSITKYSYTSPPYNPIGLLSRETIQNSDLDSLSVGYRYAGDVLGACPPAPLQNDVQMGVVQMLNSNMTGVVLEKINRRNNLVTDATMTYYIERNEQLQPSVVYKLQSDTPVTDYTQFVINPATKTPIIDSRLSAEINYEQYDSQGNILQVIGRDGITISYVWGYNQQYVVAKVIGASYTAVKTALGHSSDGNDLMYLQNMYGTVLETELDKLRTNLPGAQVNTYTFKPGIGPLSIINPNGVKTTYNYDGYGRLNLIRDNNNNIVERTLYHYQNNSDFEAVSDPYISPTTYIISCTAETGGTCSVSSGTFNAGDVINLNTEFPVNPSSSSYEFDGYYINGIKVTNPSSYSVQSTITLQARFAPIAQDFYVTVMLGSEQLLESSYSVEIQSSTGPTIASQIIKPDDPELSSLVNNNNFPVTITITTRALLPSLRITVDGTIVFDNYYGNVPSGYSFTTDPLNSGAHTVTIETP